MQSQLRVELPGDDLVDSAAVGGRSRAGGKRFQVTAAGNDIRSFFPALLDEMRNAARLMLSVAVDRHQHLIPAAEREIEGRNQGRSVTQVLRMGNKVDIAPCASNAEVSSVEPSLNNQHLMAIPPDLVQDSRDMGRFVEYRECRQYVLSHTLIIAPEKDRERGRSRNPSSDKRLGVSVARIAGLYGFDRAGSSWHSNCFLAWLRKPWRYNSLGNGAFPQKACIGGGLLGKARNSQRTRKQTDRWL